MKKMIILLLALLAATVYASAEDLTTPRLEGKGFDSPEDAVMAYIDAMNRGDVGGMLSTFALESFAEHADPYLYVERIMKINLAGIPKWFPTEDAFYRSLAVQTRYGLLAANLLQNLAYAANGSYSPSVRTPEERQALMDQLSQSPLYHFEGNTAFVRWISPAQFMNGSAAMLPGTGRDISMETLYAGAEDVTEVLAEISVQGQTAIQGMTCAKYNGRWYNLEFGGRTISLSGAKEAYAMTLWFPSEEEKAALDRQLSEDCTAEIAAWNALAESDMAGATWPLISLSLPGITVAETREEVESDSAGVWAEVSFHRSGGAVITFAAGASLREKLGMESSAARIGFGWSPNGVPTNYYNKKGISIPLFKAYNKLETEEKITVSEAVLDGDTLTLGLDGGVLAVFKKPQGGVESSAAAPETTAAITKLEGPGFDSPEEAVLAYIDAMNRGDVRSMLSTFAFETYTAHADPTVYLDQAQQFNAQIFSSIPYLDSDMVRALAAYTRYGYFAQNLLSNFAAFTANIDVPISLKSLQEIRDFQDLFRTFPLSAPEGKVEFVQWVSPACLTQGAVTKAAYASSRASADAMDNPEDETCLVAQLRLSGYDAYAAMRCACYGGRWYNLEPATNISFALHSDYMAARFLWIPTEQEKADYARYLDGYQAENAAWEALQESELAGKSWQLTEATWPDGDPINVYPLSSDAAADAELGVQGEIRLFRTGGGLIFLTVSPALQSALDLENSLWRISFGWQAGDAGNENPTFDAFRDIVPRGKEYCVNACQMSPDGKEITVILYNGMQTVFQRP